MARILGVLLLAVGLAGCAPSVIGVYKEPGYEQRINKPWVVLLATQLPQSGGGTIGVKAQKALDALNEAMKLRLPTLAADAGWTSALVIASDPEFSKQGYRNFKAENGATAPHFLLIRPHRLESKCGGVACRSSVTVITSIFDSRLGKEVWQVSTVIPEKSGLQTFDAGDVDAYWALVMTQLKQSGLL